MNEVEKPQWTHNDLGTHLEWNGYWVVINYRDHGWVKFMVYDTKGKWIAGQEIESSMEEAEKMVLDVIRNDISNHIQSLIDKIDYLKKIQGVIS